MKKVFFQIKIADKIVGLIKFKLFNDVVPKTAESNKKLIF
jgi:hypothetical protein